MRLQQFASALSCAAAFSKYPEWKVSPTRTGSFDDGIQTMNRRARLTRAASLAAFVVGSLLAAGAQVPEKGVASVSRIEEDIRAHPYSPKLYVALGLAFWDRNDFSHALEAFQRAVKLGPSSPEAHNWLGVATMQKGDVLGAIAEFRKAISLNAKYARAYTNLGSAMAKNGDLAGAIGIFQRALALEPNNAAAHVNLGVALREKGDAKAALVHLRLAIKLEPDSVNAQYLLGQTLQQSGDLGGAIETFENLLRIDPEFREGYYALGVALKQQAASQRKPRQPSASQADELYKRGQQVAARGEMKEAQQLLAEALSKDNSHAGAQNLLGFLFGQQGDLTSALIHLERAVALQPEYDLPLQRRGRVVEVQDHVPGSTHGLERPREPGDAEAGERRIALTWAVHRDRVADRSRISAEIDDDALGIGQDRDPPRPQVVERELVDSAGAADRGPNRAQW